MGDGFIQKRARQLRRELTVPERKLWHILRGRRLGELKFRRQQPLGEFIVDFVCFDARVIVEVDGMSHAGRAEADEQRERWLESQDFKVVRVTNDDVLQSEDAVAEHIARACGLDW